MNCVIIAKLSPLPHKVLDEYVNQLLESLNMNMKQFSTSYTDSEQNYHLLKSIEYYLLQAFDRGYWFKHEKGRNCPFLSHETFHC